MRTNEQLMALTKVLDLYYDDADMLDNFSGYYEIEDRLKKLNIGPGKAMVILRYLKAEGRYEGLIEKMDSGGSPTECRTFKLPKRDQ